MASVLTLILAVWSFSIDEAILIVANEILKLAS